MGVWSSLLLRCIVVKATQVLESSLVAELILILSERQKDMNRHEHTASVKSYFLTEIREKLQERRLPTASGEIIFCQLYKYINTLKHILLANKRLSSTNQIFIFFL